MLEDMMRMHNTKSFDTSRHVNSYVHQCIKCIRIHTRRTTNCKTYKGVKDIIITKINLSAMFNLCNVFAVSIVMALLPAVIASTGTNFGNADSPNGFDHGAIQSDLFQHVLPHLDPLSFARFLVTRQSHKSYGNKVNIYDAINNFLEQTDDRHLVDDMLG